MLLVIPQRGGKCWDFAKHYNSRLVDNDHVFVSALATIYIYCPVWRETRRFAPPSPSGDMNFQGGTNLRVSRLTGQLIVYHTESCSTTLYSAERCAVRHDRETLRLEGNTTICSSLDQSYFFIRHINYMRYNNIGDFSDVTTYYKRNLFNKGKCATLYVKRDFYNAG